jgi:hypothetical protein
MSTRPLAWRADSVCRRTAPLPPGWSLLVDELTATAWHAVLDGFADATLYQSWAWGDSRARRAGWLGRMLHVRLLHQGRVCAAAQVNLYGLPDLPSRFLRLGLGLLRWGPLWQAHGQPADPQVLARMLACLRHEVVERRGLVLRILPCLFEATAPADGPQGPVTTRHRLLLDAGYTPEPGDAAQRTLLLPLDLPLETLRAGLAQKWRNGLNHAERDERAGLLQLAHQHGGTVDAAAWATFAAMHQQMCARKHLPSPPDVALLPRLQAELPERHRLQLMLARTASGEPAAGLVFSRIGDMGVYLQGATTDAGLHSHAANLLQWRALAWLREHGARSYNLHGIHPVANPGTYHFKSGLSGRHGQDLHTLGAWVAAPGPRTAKLLLGLSRSLRPQPQHTCRPDDPSALPSHTPQVTAPSAAAPARQPEVQS